MGRAVGRLSYDIQWWLPRAGSGSCCQGCFKPAAVPRTQWTPRIRRYWIFLGIYPVLLLGHYIHGSVWYSLGYKVRLAALSKGGSSDTCRLCDAFRLSTFLKIILTNFRFREAGKGTCAGVGVQVIASTRLVLYPGGNPRHVPTGHGSVTSFLREGAGYRESPSVV